MAYDNLHNITSKIQRVKQYGIQFNDSLMAGYDLGYIYANNPQQISNIADTSYRTESTIAKTANPDRIREQNYSYDANGNLLCVITGTKNTDGKLIRNNERKLLWDEENRLLALSDNGFVSNYWYDAAGERTVKESGDGQGVSVNGVLSGATTGTTNFTAYISPYLVVNNGGNYTKHIYIGSQRITSKVSNSGIFGTSPVTTSALQSKYATLTAKIKARFDSLGVTYQGVAQAGGLESKTPSTASSPYFYHSDHLGSSSLITDGSGAVTQHLEYVPFGDVFVDERRSATSWTTPYLFSAKERDEETGLTYFGARYYDSRTSVWLSSDDLREQYPNVSSYIYCLDNPVRLIDPDGNSPRGASYSTAILGWLIPPAKANTPGQMMQKDGFQRKIGHASLDAVGMLPIVGEFFDGFNGLLYGVEGNKTDAAFSLASCLPVMGWFATGAKWTKNTFKLSNNALHLTSGLILKLGSKEGNRLSHVMAHFSNDLTKKFHGVFTIKKSALAETLNEAWDNVQKNGIKPIVDEKTGNWVYDVAMNREVGIEGGKLGSGEVLDKIKIVTKPNTTEVITAFPTK